MTTQTAAAARPRPRWDERIRVETAVPLLAAYFALAVLYAWQAWRREAPTIFTDELETTQISRAIAATGHPGRRGESYIFTSLVPWLTAPVWWIGDVPTAFATLKYLQTLVMAGAIVPAYLLARMVVSRPWALFAAVATIAAPALSYAPILVEEPFAYPAAVLTLWLAARAVARPTRRTFALAAASAVVAALVRSQLVALVGVLAIPFLVLGWRSDRMRRFRSTWSGWDRAGAIALGVGGVLLLTAVAGHVSPQWATTTAFWKDRIVQYGVWAAGAFAIGVGILPAIAGLAALVRPRAELRDRNTLAFVLVSASATGSIGFYAALKGAYISTVFSSLTVERNLVYLTPVVFTGLVLLLERRNPRWWAVLAATGAVLYAVVDTPMRLDQYPYYEAHGLSILAFANRVLAWPEVTIERWLIGIVLVSGALLLAVGLLRARRRLVLGIGVATAAAALAWNLTAEIYAANGERRLSGQFVANFVHPADWVDRAVGGDSVTILGQQFGNDANGIHLTEFFNRSVKRVWSVDPASAAPPPGPVVTTDLARPDGTLFPSAATRYVLAVNGVELRAPVVARLRDGTTTLYRLDGPLRLRANQSGVASDGWMGTHAAYNRFTGGEDPLGFARVTLSREAFCTDRRLPSRMTVRIGPLGIGADKQPALAAVATERSLVVAPCKAQTVLLRPPKGPWRVEVTAQTFVPAKVDPRLSDRRELGARVSFGLAEL